VNAQATRVTPGAVTPTVTIIVWIVVAFAALVLLVVVLIIVAILIKYWTVLRKRAAQRAMTLRAQRGIQEPNSTAQSCAFQQPHHIHSLSSEATHTLENSVLHPTASTNLTQNFKTHPHQLILLPASIQCI